jgi:RNA polymerase sigma-70 factor, ECF subfamily
MKRNSSAEELLSLAAQHDPDAFGELYDQCAPSLLGMLMQILGDRGAAEEILEEVFLRVWGEAQHFSRWGASLAMGLVLMARARAVERLRSEQGLPPLSRFSTNRKALAWLPKAAEIAHLDERQELLRKVVNQLPKPQRKVLELALFKGLTEEEIAAELGEPSARVTAGMLAAMRFLRHRLAAVMGLWTANI